MTVKFPDITVNLSGEDGNIFSIMGHITRAMLKGGVQPDEVNKFLEFETSSRNYDAALQVCMKWINVA